MKKPYQKPEIRKVTLRPEEAVLGICKRTNNGSNATRCNCSTNKNNGS